MCTTAQAGRQGVLSIGTAHREVHEYVRRILAAEDLEAKPDETIADNLRPSGTRQAEARRQ